MCFIIFVYDISPLDMECVSLYNNEYYIETLKTLLRKP